MPHEDILDLHVLVQSDEYNMGWFAICLELDIVGVGETQQKALEEVVKLVDAQLIFAAEEGYADSIWFPAPREYWARYYSGCGNFQIVPIASKAILKYRLFNNPPQSKTFASA